MKGVITIFWLLVICFGKTQSFYKTGDPIGDGWISNDPLHILSSTQTQSETYSESNLSPGASSGNNVRLNNCGPNNTFYSLTSPIISSIGRNNIRIGFGRRRSSNLAPVTLLEFYNGVSWETIVSDARPTIDDTWSSAYFDLPGSANNNGQLQFRFSYTSSVGTGCGVAANFRFDDFWVGANFKLPIQLASFDLSHLNGKPTITWSSLSEQNNHYYSLERSTDAKDFIQIKKCYGFGQGTTDKKMEYNYIDQHPFPGLNYYRLRQVDLDGTETVYPAKSIFLAPEKTIVFPTMFQSSISILFTDPPSQNGKWQLLNTNGQLISKGLLSDQNIRQEIFFGDLAPGVYSFLVNVKTGKEVFKLIKY